MKYLVTTNNSKPFFTNWFDANNHFNKEVEMVVYDLFNHLFTTNGKEWNDIEIDSLKKL